MMIANYDNQLSASRINCLGIKFIIIITIDHWIDMRLRHKASELNLIQAWLGESVNHKSQTLRKGSNINSTLHGFLTSDLPVALRQTTSMELQKQPSISKWVTLQGFSEDMGREGRYFCFMFFFLTLWDKQKK